LSLFEIILSVLTGLYVLFAALQWCAIKEQARLMRMQFVLSQRPRLIVRNIVTREPAKVQGGEPEPFVPGAFITGQFYVTNVGGSRAEITQSLCWVRAYFGVNLPMETPYEGSIGNNPVQGILEAGQSAIGVIGSGSQGETSVRLTQEQFKGIFPKNDPELQAIGSSRWSLYVLGWIRYRDDIGLSRTTAFCRRYNPVIERFEKVIDLDYEHEE